MFCTSRVCACFLALVLCCLLTACGGGGSQTVTAIPQIGSLSTALALAGQTVVVTGSNFGTTQGTSSLSLNGLAFTITAWTDTRIEAEVPTGATSGTVTVTVSGRASQGGAEAQLEVRSVLPVLNAVTPDSAAAGATVALTGTAFGATACSVVFSDANGTEYAATVTAWTDTSAEVTVPSLPAGEATVALGINTWRSDGVDFICAGGSGGAAPVITSVTPPAGGVGTTIMIYGSAFGEAQSGSTLLLGDVPMEVVSWSSGQIEARVPTGAVSARLRLTIPSFAEVQWPTGTGELFVVGEPPEITGINPGQMVIGQPLTIYGTGFGDSRGMVRIGGQLQSLGDWEPFGTDGGYRITIPELRPFTADPMTHLDGNGNTIVDQYGLAVEYYYIIVTTDDDLDSPKVPAPRGTDLEATVSVNHLIGERSEPDTENGTVFSFSAEVTGGSGYYSLELTPNTRNPEDIVDDYNPMTKTLDYIYPAAPFAMDGINYPTLVRVIDDETGDYLRIPGPTLMVVNPEVPVIESMGVYSFNRGYPAPNPLCLSFPNELYGGFSFGQHLYYTSNLGTVTEGETVLDKYTRDLGSYMIDGDRARSLGYRYYVDDGSDLNDGAIIAVRGLNFGDDPGTVLLNATGNSPLAVSDLAPGVDLPTGWSDTEVRFYLPPATVHLSGSVEVIPAGASEDSPRALSPTPLVCSPYIVAVAPHEDLYVPTDVVTLTGFDLNPPHIPGSVGDGIYSIWLVPVRYVDPWTGGTNTSYGILTNPVPAAQVAGTVVQFVLADLDPDQDGLVQVEVYNAPGTETAIVEGMLSNGDYLFFLWTGVLEEGTPEEIANSGIFSERYILDRVWHDLPTNQYPVANLSANPTTGTPPLEVTFNGSSSVDDGTITNYEWDFDGNGTYSDSAEEIAAEGSPGPHVITYTQTGNFAVRLRVTDDGGLVDVDAQVISVSAGAPDNTITLNVYVADFENFDATSQTLARLYDGNPASGGTPIAQYMLDHVAAGAGNPATCVFEELEAGDVYYIRLQTVVIQWDDDAEPEPIRDFGPYSVPPNTVVDIYGTQYREPPGPS